MMRRALGDHTYSAFGRRIERGWIVCFWEYNNAPGVMLAYGNAID